MVIDFSAHDSWDRCPAYWYEKYVNKRQRRWLPGQRSDALCLGSMVHAGLQVWAETGVLAIPPEVVSEVTPTEETYRLAQELIYGYTMRYPAEQWPLIRCEEPITFPLAEPQLRNCPYECPEPGVMETLTGLAKIDQYFYVPEATPVETGVPGITHWLNPGWWIHEYKTKSPYIPIGIYMQGWEMGMQASYQMLALRHAMFERGEEAFRQMARYPSSEGPAMWGEVQGVLVNVLEKPRRHVPQRTCKSCKEKYEFASWLPTGTGEYACPVCGNRQVLTPLKENTPMVPPEYYRIAVTRSEAELQRDKREIIQVGQRMLQMEANGLYSEPWRHATCVDTKWNRACDYFQPHRSGVDTRELGEYVEPAPYRGLINVEGV